MDKWWESSDIQATWKIRSNDLYAVRLFFLPEPPKETVPIADLGTVGNQYIGSPSPELLDTMYICQQRQEWYRDFARSIGDKPLPFVGSVSIKNDTDEVARKIRQALGFSLEERRKIPTWAEALRQFIQQADSFGVMVGVIRLPLNCLFP